MTAFSAPIGETGLYKIGNEFSDFLWHSISSRYSAVEDSDAAHPE